MAIWRDERQEYLKSDFSIDVTIIEVTKKLTSSANGSTRILSNFKINSPSRKETLITLPAPIPVRPGFYYEIRLKPPRCSNHIYRCGNLMAEIKMENDLSIKFHGDLEVNGRLVNIITALGFIKKQMSPKPNDSLFKFLFQKHGH